MDIVTYALCRKLVSSTAQSLGSLKGAACQIQSIVEGDLQNVITFKWEGNNGAINTSTLTVKNGINGENGKGISEVTIDEQNRLHITLEDGTEQIAGYVQTIKGDKGDDGKSAYELAVENGYTGTEEEYLESLKGENGLTPEITVAEDTETVYKLNIKVGEDEFETPNLKGGGGTGGSSIDDETISTASTYSSHKIEHSITIAQGEINDELSDRIDAIERQKALVQYIYDEIPSAQDNPQMIFQYVGDNNGIFKRGYVYYSQPTVVGTDIIYDWVQIDVQPSSMDYEEQSNHPTLNDVEIVGDKTSEDYKIQDKLQYATLPNPNLADHQGKLYQYIGVTNSNYKYGYWYRSTYNNDTLVYEWKEVVTFDISDLDLQHTIQYVTMPDPDPTDVGKIIQYIGGNTSEYKTGYFYRLQFNPETSEYEWIEINVSDNEDLKARVTQLETDRGDMSTLEIPAVTNLVDALNAVNNKDLQAITYEEPYLIFTYKDGNTFRFDLRAVLLETQIGELANVIDDTIQDTNILQYDVSIQRYKPYDIVTTLVNLLQEAKDYTDLRISNSLKAGALVCDSKPTLSKVDDEWVVVYYQSTELKTTNETETRFYYYDDDGKAFCTSWIDGIEFTYAVADVDFDDFVSKSKDLTDSYAEDMVDKDKVPTIASLDALLTILKETYLPLKVNVDDIATDLVTDSDDKVLAASQGKELKDLVDTKNNIFQYTEMPFASQNQNRVIQYVGVTSNAYKKGAFYKSAYDSTNEAWLWEEISFSTPVDNEILQDSTNPVENGVIYTALQGKQDLMQVTVMPDATENEGKVFIYVGETVVDSYVKGQSYISDGTDWIPTASKVDIATVENVGVVKPDGVTIKINENGTISTPALMRITNIEDVPENPSDGDTFIYLGDNVTNFSQGDTYIYNSTTEEWTKITYNVTEVDELLGDIGDWEVVEHPTAEQIQLTADNIWGTEV